MNQSQAPVGTVATIGHPANGRLIAKGPAGWVLLSDGSMVDPEDFRAGWDIYTPVPVESPAAVSSAIIRYFSYAHLPPHLQEVSKAFYFLARQMDAELPNGPEKSVALRKLLEGKDAAVRAALG
jgi:hypothetical protein